MIESATAINSLSSHAMQADFVPPSEEAAFILSASQLSALISQAIEKAIQPLQDRISGLEATVAQQNEKIAASEKWQGTLSDNQYTQLKLINSIREESHKEEIARTANTTQKTQDNITRIAVILANKEKRLIEGQAPRAYVDRLRKEGMTFSELATIMDLTVDRIRQLSGIAAGDQRFNVTWHPRKKNTKIIKLRRWDVQGL